MLGFDFERGLIKWDVSADDHELPSMVVSCNDLFLKTYLASFEGLQNLHALGQNARCRPSFEVLLVRNGSDHLGVRLGEPSVSVRAKMQGLLFQTFIERQSFLSVKDELKQLISSVEVTNVEYPGEWEFNRRWVEVFAELEGRGHSEHGWLSFYHLC